MLREDTTLSEDNSEIPKDNSEAKAQLLLDARDQLTERLELL